ncbi:MAG: aminotransferase class III-fold pyridoxal phosphate-dependent enzyme, partial [Anaerolineae bacterium]
LMVGIELKTQSGQYLGALAEKGVLALPAGGTVMRFLPPLVISEADIETVIEKVAAVLTV